MYSQSHAEQWTQEYDQEFRRKLYTGLDSPGPNRPVKKARNTSKGQLKYYELGRTYLFHLQTKISKYGLSSASIEIYYIIMCYYIMHLNDRKQASNQTHKYMTSPENGKHSSQVVQL